jgi:hypothetical protein
LSAKSKPIIRLDAWQEWELPSGFSVLWGLATGHPRYPGRRTSLHTSLLVKLDLEAGIAETMNSIYQLGPRLTGLAEDDQGVPAFVSMGDLSALRYPGTSLWDVARGPELLHRMESHDVVEVIGRMLDIILPPDSATTETGTRH